MSLRSISVPTDIDWRFWRTAGSGWLIYPSRDSLFDSWRKQAISQASLGTDPLHTSDGLRDLCLDWLQVGGEVA